MKKPGPERILTSPLLLYSTDIIEISITSTSKKVEFRGIFNLDFQTGMKLIK